MAKQQSLRDSSTTRPGRLLLLLMPFAWRVRLAGTWEAIKLNPLRVQSGEGNRLVQSHAGSCYDYV